MSDQALPIKNYKLVTGTDHNVFSEEVNRMIDMGFQPHGETRVIFATNTSTIHYSQAMVEYMTVEEVMEQALSMFDDD